MAGGWGAGGEISNGHKEETFGGWDYAPYLGCDKGVTDVRMSKYQIVKYQICTIYCMSIIPQ